MARSYLDVEGLYFSAVTVHRVGCPLAEEGPLRAVDLGRVLVTIDDLAALMTFLTRSMAGANSKINVEFDGGYFTEPNELRTLSDSEMSSLRLKTQKVEVILNQSAAFAVGDYQEAWNVYRIWAKPRRIQLKPKSLGLFGALYYFLLVLLAISLTITISMLMNMKSGSHNVAKSVGVLGFCIVISLLNWRRNPGNNWGRDPKSYAVIIPLSLNEHRQNLASQMYPRRSWIVAIVSAIIAALAVAAAVWVKVTK